MTAAERTYCARCGSPRTSFDPYCFGCVAADELVREKDLSKVEGEQFIASMEANYRQVTSATTR